MRHDDHAGGTSFRHEALFYDGHDDFLSQAVPFVRDGIEAGDPTLVMTPPERVEALRSALGNQPTVTYGDMTDIGRNPGRIISAWADFVAANRGRRIRGIGEPIWAGRSPDELIECQRHETLLNLALADENAWVLCPYDTTSLSGSILEEARRSHPLLVEGDTTTASDAFDVGDIFSGALPEPRTPLLGRLDFDELSTGPARAYVARHAETFGLPPDRVDDLTLAVGEAMGNSLRHGGGHGHLRVWRTGNTLVVEVSDKGRITEQMAGRTRPPKDNESGIGLWLIHQITDLVQVRSTVDGSVVRMHFAR